VVFSIWVLLEQLSELDGLLQLLCELSDTEDSEVELWELVLRSVDELELDEHEALSELQLEEL